MKLWDSWRFGCWFTQLMSRLGAEIFPEQSICAPTAGTAARQQKQWRSQSFVLQLASGKEKRCFCSGLIPPLHIAEAATTVWSSSVDHFYFLELSSLFEIINNLWRCFHMHSAGIFSVFISNGEIDSCPPVQGRALLLRQENVSTSAAKQTWCT